MHFVVSVASAGILDTSRLFLPRKHVTRTDGYKKTPAPPPPPHQHVVRTSDRCDHTQSRHCQIVPTQGPVSPLRFKSGSFQCPAPTVYCFVLFAWRSHYKNHKFCNFGAPISFINCYVFISKTAPSESLNASAQSIMGTPPPLSTPPLNLMISKFKVWT